MAGGGPWVVVVLGTCLAGCLSAGVEDSLGETPDDLDYQFDANYIAMKKAASGVNIPNPELIVIYGLEAAALKYAITHKLNYLSHQEVSKNTSKVYVAVLNGECVPSPPGSDRCLTERDARMLMFKEAWVTVHKAAALITEAGVRTRLQWFQENGVDDIVMILSTNIQNLISDLVEALRVPIKNLWKQISKFRNILVKRYTSGTGSGGKLVSAADAVSSEVYAIVATVISKQYPAFRFYRSAQGRIEQYSVMFQDNLAISLAKNHHELYKDSPYPFVNRYWDARALEYSVSWLFRMRKESNFRDVKEFDRVLKELYTKLETGHTEEVLQFANHLLSKAMDKLGHKIFSKYLEQPMQSEIKRLQIPLPTNLEDLNPLGIPKSLREAETTPMGSFLGRYLHHVEEESVNKVLFDQFISFI